MFDSDSSNASNCEWPNSGPTKQATPQCGSNAGRPVRKRQLPAKLREHSELQSLASAEEPMFDPSSLYLNCAL